MKVFFETISSLLKENVNDMFDMETSILEKFDIIDDYNARKHASDDLQGNWVGYWIKNNAGLGALIVTDESNQLNCIALADFTNEMQYIFEANADGEPRAIIMPLEDVKLLALKPKVSA